MGTINIYNHKQNKSVKIRSKDEFFKGEVLAKNNGSKLSFRKPTMDYRGKTLKTYYDKILKRYSFLIYDDLPIGSFEFDKEESDEDVKVIYLTN